MQSQVTEITSILVEIDVEFPWDAVNEALEEKYTGLTRTAQVKGFRRGKVPKGMIRKLFGPQVKADVMQSLVSQGLSKAVQEHKIPLVNQPELEGEPSIQKGEAFAFKLKAEVRPKLEKVETEGIEVTRASSDVTDEDIDTELQKLREQNADLQEPDPMRDASEGDIVVCSYEPSVDGEPRPEMNAQDRSIELSPDVTPEFRDALLGSQPGKHVAFDMKMPEDAGSELAGKTVHFELDVTALKEKVLPDLDDDFAKDLDPGHDSLEALTSSIKDRLTSSKAEQSKSGLREQVIDSLVEKNPIELPPSMVQQQQQAMMQEYLRILQMTGQSPSLGDNFMEDMLAKAEQKVRAAVLLSELARLQELEVSPDELDAKLTEMAEESGKHIAKVRAEMQGDGMENLESQLLEDKLLEYLLGQATITEG